MIHDFCGGLGEELLRTNFILVYELIDELIVSFLDKIIGLWSPIDYQSRYFEIICQDRSRKMLSWYYVKPLVKLIRDYLWSSFRLDKLKLMDSVSERESD